MLGQEAKTRDLAIEGANGRFGPGTKHALNGPFRTANTARYII
jgi:hypothetical protein